MAFYTGRMTIQEFLALDWQLLKDEPVIQPPGRIAGPIVADPTFSGPDTSPDGRWHLFAHTIRGIEHFVSDDGETWAHARRVTRQGMRAYLVLHEGVNFLFYEQPRFRYADIISLFHIRWHSRLVFVTSPDLVHWSAPETVLDPSLSGVGRALQPDETLWYARTFVIPSAWMGQHVLLHFGAVDWSATVALNGHVLGKHQ